MGIFSRRGPQTLPTSTLPALTASAVLIGDDTEDAEASERYLRRQQRWIERAWRFYNEIPEVRYAARYFGDALSRLTLFAGVRDDAWSDPVPMDPNWEPEKGKDPPPYTIPEAVAATDVLARLRNPNGGQAEIMRRIGVQLFIPGEAILFGRDSGADGERWDVFSTDELRLTDDKWTLREPSSGEGGSSKVRAEYAKGSVVAVRIWRPHPQWSEWSDSPMRAADLILDELLILTKAIKAVALSRAAGAGMLFLPDSIRNNTQGRQAQLTAGGGNAAKVDTVAADMVKATATAISDPGSAASQVPVIVYVPDKVYAEIGTDKLIRWSRELDEVMERQRESLLRRFATAADLPAEVLTGMSNLNHWTAWQIPEEAFRSHFEPAAVLTVNALTATFMRPLLIKSGQAELAERAVVWYDPSGLVSPPDQSSGYQDAYDRGEASGESYRRAIGIPEDDKPSEEEIAERMAMGWRPFGAGGGGPTAGAPDTDDEGERGTPEPVEPAADTASTSLKDRVNAATQLIRAGFEPGPTMQAFDLPVIPHTGLQPVTVKPPEEATPEPQKQTTTPPPGQEQPVVASAAPIGEPIPGLADTLASMDSTLSRDILGAADAAFRRALERANARVKSLASNGGGDRTLKAAVKDLAPADLTVAPALGSAVVDRLANAARMAGENEDGAALLFAGAFGKLGVEWERRTNRVAEETIRLAVARGELSEAEASTLLDRLVADTHAGWLLLLAALTAIAVEKLYRPLPDDGPGEVVDQLLPPAIVRAALARAGGGGKDAVSMLTGQTVLEIFRQARIEFSAWRWSYGDPSARGNLFEPHYHLDGRDISGPEDPQLVHASTFPPSGRYWPNDHRGCLCNVVRVDAVFVGGRTIDGRREVA